MKSKLGVVLALLFLTACAASIPKEQLAKFAFIRPGSTNFWSVVGGGSTVSLTAIDGQPASTKNGPVAVTPGKHEITMTCAGHENTFEVDFKVGEIYEYTYGVGGPKGCFGGLIKVN